MAWESIIGATYFPLPNWQTLDWDSFYRLI